MATVEDIVITLGTDQHFQSAGRNIRVDLSSRVNFGAFSLQPYFSFNTEAFNAVEVDDADPTGIIISVRRDVQLSRPENAFDINYSAQSSVSNETLTGKVIFTNDDDYQLTGNDITYTLEDCCCLPQSIAINIRDFNGGQPFVLDEVGENNEEAGTVTLQNVDANDYNDDYNDDFGAPAETLIIYTFNQMSQFWKKAPAQDKFVYTATLNGKQIRGTITIDGKNCFTATGAPQPFAPSEFLAQENTSLINQENGSNFFV